MTGQRLTAAERRQQIVAAAVTAFAVGGYAGTTTDQVARLAGVSQPYVLRIHGSKRALFIAALGHATTEIALALREVPPAERTPASLGRAWEKLVVEGTAPAMLLHGAMAGADPAISHATQRCFGELYDTVRELIRADPAQLGRFFAAGLLTACLTQMRATGPDPVEVQPWMADLILAMRH